MIIISQFCNIYMQHASWILSIFKEYILFKHNMKHFVVLAYMLSLKFLGTNGQCNTFPIIFGSGNGDTNITVIEYSAV